MNIPKKNLLEWVIFTASLVLVVGVLAYLSYDSLTRGDAPPSLTVEVGAAEQRAEHFVVPIAVTNGGDQTAEGVQVEVVLQNGAQQERAMFEIAFLPRGASGQGWASFRTNPRAGGELKARVIGYEQP